MTTTTRLWMAAACLLFTASAASASPPNTRYRCSDDAVKKEATNALATLLGSIEPWPTHTKRYSYAGGKWLKESRASHQSWVDNSFWNSYAYFGETKYGTKWTVKKVGGSTGANLIFCEYEITGAPKSYVGKSGYKNLRLVHQGVHRIDGKDKQLAMSFNHWSRDEARKFPGQVKVQSLVHVLIVESDSYTPLARFEYGVFATRY